MVSFSPPNTIHPFSLSLEHFSPLLSLASLSISPFLHFFILSSFLFPLSSFPHRLNLFFFFAHFHHPSIRPPHSPGSSCSASSHVRPHSPSRTPSRTRATSPRTQHTHTLSLSLSLSSDTHFLSLSLSFSLIHLTHTHTHTHTHTLSLSLSLSLSLYTHTHSLSLFIHTPTHSVSPLSISLMHSHTHYHTLHPPHHSIHCTLSTSQFIHSISIDRSIARLFLFIHIYLIS